VIAEEGVTRPRSVISDTTVGPLWGKPAAESIEVPLIELEDGEQHKRWPAVEGLLGRWLDDGLHRGDTVAAVGGGVLTDTVGFAAAVFLRGIDWIAVPTTLLAMVDASVGGKTGVNLEQGKNLVGAFWPPRLVAIDVETLSTLPERELRAGMAEVIKTAWIGDHDLLSMIPSTLDDLSTGQRQELVMRCVAVKARVVSEDEREAGKRAALNLGHTLGHALEAATGYRHFLHGEAVAWGLLAAAKLGRRHGVLSSEGEEAITTAVATLGPLPSLADIDPAVIGSAIGFDKKKSAGGIGWVLPTDMGVALNQSVVAEEALKVLQELKNTSISRD
jgi:3-dehydroquinate synthase